MNRIVVYTSKTGFTQKYAEWIAKDLGCDAVALKKIKLSALSEYDQVIYGGWIMGGMVSGYDKIKSLDLKELVVFCTGMSLSSDEVREKIARQNGIPVEQLYYFEGGFAPSKVGFMGRMIVKMIAGSLDKKVDKTAEDIHMLEAVKGADNTDRTAMKALVDYCVKR